MKVLDCKQSFKAIYNIIKKEKDFLIKLDQAFGDGDLGISMTSGFGEIAKLDTEETDIGRYFLLVSKTFNETAPSSLGTILSFMYMGMAKSLKGKEDASLEEVKQAFISGVELLKEKANSKQGQKTILDSLEPAVDGFCSGESWSDAFKKAHTNAECGMQSTKDMIAVHGRAAYHKEKTLGHIDGGAYLAYIIFKTLDN